MKLSKSEAGKLGNIKSQESKRKLKELVIIEYLENPCTCTNCGASLSYEERHKKFCNSSCSATFNNKKRSENKQIIKNNCMTCNKELSTEKGSFCNSVCQQQFYYNEYIKQWLQGDDVSFSKPRVKKYLLEKQNFKCDVCGITDWCDKPIVLDLEHKDGDSTNNKVDNLCLICPNCHSQTDTYKGKNKGNGRFNRRKRYADGKSY